MSTRNKKKRAANNDDLCDINPHKKRRLSQLSPNNNTSNQTTFNHTSNNNNNTNPNANKNPNDDINTEEEDFDFEDNTGFSDDDNFENSNENDWDNLGELNYDGQKTIEISNNKLNNLSAEKLFLIKKEKQRKLNSDLNKFWTCGKCLFLNHPSYAQCLSCNMPEMDVIRYLLNCIKPLKQCLICNSYIIPSEYNKHILDCEPIIKNTNNSIKKQWHCKLSKSEKNAICYVTNLAAMKSNKNNQKEKLLNKILNINKENNYIFSNGKNEKNSENEILNKLLLFLEWKVPITIRIHCNKLIPKLLNDTNYRNLFETGYGSGNTNQNIRKREEMKMFGEVYFGANPDERPKYGCLNVNLKPEGCILAYQYGDGYFVMNNITIRWRVTMTIKDSFAVDGDCATLKNCIHLLNQLDNKELKEMIYISIFGKCEKNRIHQKEYREIQIHGPVILNRDIYSLNVPDDKKNRQMENIYKQFCEQNDIKLIWF
eukprot:37018_1